MWQDMNHNNYHHKMFTFITFTAFFLVVVDSQKRVGPTTFAKCKTSCIERHSLCSNVAVNYSNLVQCSLDMSDCKEQCYMRRLDTLQLRLAATKSLCGGGKVKKRKSFGRKGDAEEEYGMLM